MDLDGAPRAEQERVHRDRKIRQGIEHARDLETAMEDGAFAGQRAIMLPLAERPQDEAFAHGQCAGAVASSASLRFLALPRPKPLFWRCFHVLTAT